MITINDVIDGRYKIDKICGIQGGMGKLFFVTDLKNEFIYPIVLKVCINSNEEYLNRFRREIRLLDKFRNSPYVIQALDKNPDHSISGIHVPYFVMKYYSDGDLTGLILRLNNDHALQENIFNQMINCIVELHKQNIFHRDIKPQNFLIDDNSNIIVSDFGLGVEPNSITHFTASDMYGGSIGYMPPEFYNGGFKNADAISDIYMLGKTFYALLSNNLIPMYLQSNNSISPAIYSVIERSCHLNRNERHQSLMQLQQDLTRAFDVVLNRGQTIVSLLNNINSGNYRTDDVIGFIQHLSALNDDDKTNIISDLNSNIFNIVTKHEMSNFLPQFMDSYASMVKNGNYEWFYAEIITKNMKIIFDNSKVSPKMRAKALELAIIASDLMNRYAAMDICQEMIKNVQEESLAFAIHRVILDNPYYFIIGIDASKCRSDIVRKALLSAKQSVEL